MKQKIQFEASRTSIDTSADPVGIEFESRDGAFFFGFMAEGSPTQRKKNPLPVRVSLRREGKAQDDIVRTLESVTISRSMFRAAFAASKDISTRVSPDVVDIRFKDNDADTVADLIEGLRCLLGNRVDIVRLDIPGAPAQLPHAPAPPHDLEQDET